MSSLVITEQGNGIVSVEYPLHVALTRSLLEEEWQGLRELSNLPICYLIKLRGVSLVEDDITGFIQKHYTPSHFKAVAILFNPDYGYFEYGKILIDAFLQESAINFPVRKFDDEGEAIRWLESQSQ